MSAPPTPTGWRKEEGRPVGFSWLGTIPYDHAFALQRRLAERRRRGAVPDLLLFLEHPPTYTLGRRAEGFELTASPDHYKRLGIAVHETDRGGKVTYHGPGQLVGYGIFAVRDVVAYVRAIEDALIGALRRYGLAARSRAAEGPDYTGVWVGPRKIASIGVHLSHGITTHGFALNLNNDLAPFAWIVPCGLHGVEMTSLARERKEPLGEGIAAAVGRVVAAELGGGAHLEALHPQTLFSLAAVVPC